MSITIKDLARLAGVSHTTVSRALNGSDLISPKTKEKIIALADKHNYIPNYNAKSLVLNKSYNIGCFFSTLKMGTSSGFLHKILLNINKVIDNRYSLSVIGIDDISDFNLINSNRYDGIIIVSQSSRDDIVIDHIIKSNIPVVILNRIVDFPNISWVISDEKAGVTSAIDYLIQNGHKKIGFISGRDDFYSTPLRREGYEIALLNNNIPIDLKLVKNGYYTFQGGYDAMTEILKEDQPTAVFASNDDMAIGAIKAIHDNNLRIPEDVSVIGFDNSTYAEYASPSLTTVKRPMGEIASIGATILVHLMNNEPVDSYETCLKTEFIIRNSIMELQ